jgi:phosphoserine aminotransferase
MGRKAFYLTPGPSELYFTVESWLKQAFKEDIGSISHRSADFKKIYEEADGNLRALLGIPQGHTILFTNSATEIFQHLLLNCVEKRSAHFVNGAFSERFYEYALMLGLDARKVAAPFGGPCPVEDFQAQEDTELICVTHNETSSGVMIPEHNIAQIKANNPGSLLAVDAVSSIPYPKFDFNAVDSMFFSVQKGMGLPAGLGVWIVNEACAEKSARLKESGQITGTYTDLEEMLVQAEKFQTVTTPNVLGIYLLAKVSGDMLTKGADVIRAETENKAGIGYYVLENLPGMKPLVEAKTYRSKTVLVAEETQEGAAAACLARLKEAGIEAGDGYGPYKKTQIRIANFPTHSKELFEKAMDALEARSKA